MELEKAPFPSWLPPMLATLGKMPAREDAYAFEYKWDGIRAVCYWDGERLKFESRNRIDITPGYPEFAGLAKALGRRRAAVLDGEIVAWDRSGRPSFGLLQQRLGLSSLEAIARRSREIPATYMLFDLLYLDGYNVFPAPYSRRRGLLAGLGLSGKSWKTTPSTPDEGSAMLEVARKHGFEGLIAKAKESRYEPGKRSAQWIKIKIISRQEFVVGGWTPGEGMFRNAIGALLLGYYEPAGRGKKFRYAGHVGTGFTSEQRFELRERLGRRPRAESPFGDKIDRPGAVFVDPVLVADVEFTEWTADGKLRHPSFKGFRIDKRPGEVVREKAA